MTASHFLPSSENRGVATARAGVSKWFAKSRSEKKKPRRGLPLRGFVIWQTLVAGAGLEPATFGL